MGNGLFAQRVLEEYLHLAIESEKRLEKFAIQEHFLQKIFALTDFEETKRNGIFGKLVHFHTRYKFFLSAHHQSEAQRFGKILARARKENKEKSPHGVRNTLPSESQKSNEPETCD